MYSSGDSIPTTPSGLVFTGNPIIMRDDRNFSGQPAVGYPFEIECEGKIVYTGRVSYPFSINLSEILDAFTPSTPEPEGYDESIPGPTIFCVVDDDNMQNGRNFKVSFLGPVTEKKQYFAISGGISRQNYRQIAKLPDEDIFTTRFLSDNTNFFMTTRTAGWRILLKESELYPLYFINDNYNASLKIVEKMTGKQLVISDLERGILALDLNAVRYRFFVDSGILVNYFDIFRNDSFACSVVIEQAEAVKERYRLKFRNSLGVFEIIELTGETTFSPEWKESEDTIIDDYDPLTDYYTSARDRLERKLIITVKTGVKLPKDITFIMDMLGSDEVYLLGITDHPVRVIPEAEDFNYSARPESPQSFIIKLSAVESEKYITPEITDETEFSRRRIHSKEFSREFN